MVERAVLIALLALTACNDGNFVKLAPAKATQAHITKPFVQSTPADILFVIDNSGSMADKQDNLARNLKSFIERIVGTGDYRIGVITTDNDSVSGEQAGAVHYSFSTTPPFANLGQDTSQCMSLGTGHGCFRGPVIDSSMPAEAQTAAFKSQVLVGTCGSPNEVALDTMIKALENTRGAGCNAGFLRDEANLVVVILSDEDDSDPSVPVAQYVEQLKTFKDVSKIRVATIVATQDGAAANCRIDSTTGQPASCGSLCSSTPPSAGMPGADTWQYCYWCSYFNASDCCTAISADRYVAFSQAVEQAVHTADPTNIDLTGCQPMAMKHNACLIDSICQTEYDQTLERIATQLIVNARFPLDPLPTPGSTVVVEINGHKLDPADYSVKNGVVTITGGAAPKVGDSVDIYFIIDD